MAKKVYIGVDNVPRKVKKVYAGVDGVARKVKKGYIGVNGVARLFWQSGKPLSEYPHGSIVYLNENGSPVAFYVAKHDYESGLNGAGRTLLVRKDAYDKRMYDVSTDGLGTNGFFDESDIFVWLNGTYKSLLDATVQTAIGKTKFYFTDWDANKYKKILSNMSSSVFLLSYTELGGTNQPAANLEGSVLPISNTLKISYYNGTAVNQWTRSLDTFGNYIFYFKPNGTYDLIMTNGIPDGSTKAGNFYSRPCFTLPSSSLFDSSTNEFLEV